MVAQPLRAASRPAAIKLLDLLTNRYHLGLIREASAAGLFVELPATSRLHAGQRVRFVVEQDQPLVSRTAMQRAFITNVSPLGAGEGQDRHSLNVQLALVPETAVA